MNSTKGTIAKKPLQILIDGGNSHNVIQLKVASFLVLDIKSSPHLSVIVGNGDNLQCLGQCQQVPFEIQGHKFTSDFYVIDLHGIDVNLLPL